MAEAIAGFRPSPQQSRAWRLHKEAPASCASLCILRIEGDLDRPALRRALARTVSRHEILRTAFRLPAGMTVPLQVILAPGPVSLPEVDLQGFCPERQAAGTADLLTALGGPPFDLEKGEGWRAALVRLGPREHRMLLALSAACADPGSFEPLASDLLAAYARQVAGQEEDPEPPLQLADVAEWQNSLLEAADTAEAVEAWREHWRRHDVGSRIALSLPLEESEPAPHPCAPRTAAVPLTRETAAALARLAEVWACPLPVLVLTAWQAVIQRGTARDETVMGLLYGGRDAEELRGVVGPLARYLPVAVRLDTAASLREAVNQVREAVAEAERRGEYFSWDHVAGNGAGGFPLCFEATEEGWELAAAGLRVSPARLTWNLDRFSLALSCRRAGEDLRLALRYDPWRFRGEAAQHLAGRLAVLLGSIAARHEAPLADHPAMAEAELSRWLELSVTPPAADRSRDGKTLHAAFVEQVDRTPDRLAVVAGDSCLTFYGLDALANRLAHHLLSAGAGPERPVALCLERSVEAVAALLAVWKTGAAYVPLDPTQPAERLAYILEDTRASLLVTDSWLGTEAEVIATRPSRRPETGAGPRDLAYVIYTSGSTGRPKGVQVEHRSALHLLAALETAVLDPPALPFPLRASLNAPMIFDASVQQLVLLLAGHTLCVVPQDIRADGAALLAFLREREVDLLDCTPSQLRLLVNAGLLDGRNVPRVVLTAGEAVDEPLWRRLAQAERTVCFNLYGPTECSVDATVHRITPGSTRPAIGRPLAGYDVFLLDRTLQPAPPGAPGELCLGGPGLARGYLRRPALTAERFVPHPFSRQPGERLYRTGDLGRHLPDGDLEFLGRLDHQIKIRGFRIEPGEIEAVLAELPGVREAVVVAHESAADDRRLVAYVAGDVAADALRQGLRERLPDYMVPAAFVMLAALPLTTNGKVDRKALPPPQWTGEDYREPRTPVEAILAGIWSELLKLDRVGTADHFFDLGGHSLLATQVMSRLRGAFGVEMPLRTLFEAPILADLAVRVEEALRAGEGRPAPPLVPVPREGALPLSFAQQRLWFIDQLAPGTPLYNIPMALRVEGPLVSGVLARSLGEIVRRHEVLRTVFAERQSSPVQVIQPAAPFALTVVDLSGLPAREREALALRLAGEEARRPFDLARGPLLRCVLLRLAEGDHIAALTVHHIAGDGWSTGILIREVTALYTAFAEGRPSPLPELPVQYADFAAWQRSWLQGEALENEISFWRRQLAGLPPLLSLPTDRPRPAVQSFQGVLRPVRLPAGLIQPAQALGRREGATLFMVLLAGFQALLSRYSGQQDLAVGSPVAGRNRTEIEGLIGFFVNMLVLRGDLTGEPSFRELLGRARETTLAAHTHQDIPFERLVQELAPARSLAQTPLFQVMFGLQNAPTESLEIRNLRLRPVGAAGTTAKFDLTLTLEERNGRLAGTVEHATDLFDAATVDRLTGHYERLLTAALAEPDLRVSELPLLLEEESRQILVDWAGVPAAPYPAGAAIHELFAAEAARSPGSVALVCGDEAVTYGDLDARADRLAVSLRELGVGSETLVGLCAERSIGLVVGLLAILKAGGAYLPFDPESPEERLRFQMEDAGVSVVLAGRSVAGRLPRHAARVVDLDGEPPRTLPGRHRLPPKVEPDNLAYVMYTSGSTGRPKGVSVTHRGVVRLCREGGFASFDEREVILQVAPVSFDASTLEIWACLLNGGRLVLPPPGLLSLEEIGQMVRGHGVTTLHLTSGLFHLMVDERIQDLAGVRQLLAGGDVLSLPHIERVLAELPECRMIACYGPTENTTFTCCHPVESAFAANDSVPLGRPINATRVYILDRHLAPVPAGVAGELLTGGAGLARGYLGRPDLTAERFIPDPHGGEPGGRLYRTGDLCRHLSHGTVEFLGRVDQQVKIRGFRIEPGEIETVLRQHPDVRDAAIVTRPESGGQKRLVACVVAADGAAPDVEELRRFLSGQLPDYMVPGVYVPLEHLPVTPNGKLDRRMLEQLAASVQTASRVAYRPPRNRLEYELARIWEEILAVERVGLDDDFFQSGGHSLLAVSLISRIEQRLGHRLPLTALFEKPTVEQLARLLREMSPDLVASPLIPLHPQGDAPPWYFVHPADGQVHRYFELSRRLGPGIPAFGLQAPGLIDRKILLSDIPAIAASYVAAIREVQPQGPYLLAGWSSGGTLAFEMARALQAQGQPVGALVLIDTVQYTNLATAADELALWLDLMGIIEEMAGAVIGLEAAREALPPLDYDGRRSYLATQLERCGLLPPALGPESLARMIDVHFAMLKALRSYEPEPYQGRGILVRATATAERHAGSSLDASFGWARFFAGGLEVRDVPGHHQSILAKDRVGALADLLAACRSVTPSAPVDAG